MRENYNAKLTKLEAKRDELQNKGKKRQGVGSKKVRLATPSGKGKTVTVGGRAAKDAARSRLNQGVATDAKNRKLKEARLKKEKAEKEVALQKKRMAMFKAAAKKAGIAGKKKPTVRKTSYEKRKGK